MTLRLRHRVPRSVVAGALPADLPGEQVGLAGVLDRLDRRARLTRVPGTAVEWGFAWDDADLHDTTWWPQGLTCSGEARRLDPSAYDGPRVLLCAWYARGADGGHAASRVTVVELASLRYRHVELVDEALAPLRVHAGGLTWSGDRLLVAATRRGLGVARLSDVRRLTTGDGREREVLPVSSWLRAEQDEEEDPLRYSFCSLDTDGPRGPRLLVGEYGGSAAARRVVAFPVDPATGMPAPDGTGASPGEVLGRGPVRMQGLVSVDGTTHATCSHGTRLPGTLHVGGAAGLGVRLGALPPGPEDLTWWPGLGLLWCQSEHPGRRFVFALRPG